MNWNRKSDKFTNIILSVICIVLIVILGGLVLTNHNEVKQESERLEKLAEKQKTGIDNYESVKEHASELEEVGSDQSSDDTKGSDEEKSSDKEAESDDTQNSDKTDAGSEDSGK